MDARQYAPSSARNRQPILAVLQRVLPRNAKVLELASGAGEHALFFACAMPGVIWQPSDPDPAARASIAAWIDAEAPCNVLPPLDIDVCSADWNVEGQLYDVLVAINMIHISPWEATLGLLAGASRLLRDNGVLYTYGPYKRNGQHTAPSNEAFEHWLQQRDPRFGVRDLTDIERAAEPHGLILRDVVEMPANNFSILFERKAFSG